MTTPPPAVVVTGARVMHPSSVVAEDLHVVGDRLVAAPGGRDAHVVDAEGASVVPLLVESAIAQLPPGERDRFELVPGNPATFAVVRRRVSEEQVRRMLVVDPHDLLAVYVAGHLEAWDGAPTRAAGEDLTDPAVRATWAGTWHDTGRALQQHLRPDGRYSETRGGRADAYTGRYWVREDRITYLDDSGFWAFGQLVSDVLHHAGFVMSRRRSLPGSTRSWLGGAATRTVEP